jgi:uncharacterized membrane protein
MKRNIQLLMAAAGTTAIGIIAYKQLKRRKYDGIKLKRSVIIDKSAPELYRYWRNFRNLLTLVDVLDSVDVLDNQHLRWTIKTPAGINASWDAEITTDRQNEMIGWRSADGSTIETAGYIQFLPTLDGRRTLVKVALEYYPPAGRIGAGLSTLLGRRPEGIVEEALRRFKQLHESGEISRTEYRRERTVMAN